MTNFDDALRTMLEGEAAQVGPDRTRLPRVVTRVRRKRAARAVGAGLIACAVVVAGLAGADATLSALDRRSDVAASQPAEPGFTWEEGTYPVLATGTYEGRRWTLSVVEDPDAAHPEDTESENPEILLESEGPPPNGGAFETHTGWSVLAEPFHTTLHDERELVMGMVTDSAASVAVETTGGETIVAGVFDGAEAPVPGTDYYFAFLPPGTSGEVVARDGDGDVMATMPLPRYEPPPDVTLGCGDHPQGAEEQTYEYELLGEGGFFQRSWALELIRDPDRAHPEDTESDNPEILFRIDGPEPNAGGYETYAGWDVLEVAYHGPIDGAEVVLGMASAEVASVGFESDDGEGGEAALYDGKDVPQPGAQHFLVFLRKGATGQLTARDASGAVVARERVEGLVERPFC